MGATGEVAAVNLILMSYYRFFALDKIIEVMYDIFLCCYITGESFLSDAEETSKQFLLALHEQ